MPDTMLVPSCILKWDYYNSWPQTHVSVILWGTHRLLVVGSAFSQFAIAVISFGTKIPRFELVSWVCRYLSLKFPFIIQWPLTPFHKTDSLLQPQFHETPLTAYTLLVLYISWNMLCLGNQFQIQLFISTRIAFSRIIQA